MPRDTELKESEIRKIWRLNGTGDSINNISKVVKRFRCAVRNVLKSGINSLLVRERQTPCAFARYTESDELYRHSKYFETELLKKNHSQGLEKATVSTKRRRRFNAAEISYNARGVPLITVIEVGRLPFQVLLMRATADLDPYDMIRFILFSDELDRPISTCLLQVSQMTVKVLLAAVFKEPFSWVADHIKEELNLPNVFASWDLMHCIELMQKHAAMSDILTKAYALIHDCMKEFMTGPMLRLPKTFGLKELAKGFFSHLFNTVQNQAYIGLLSARHFYSPDTMSTTDREKFNPWKVSFGSNKIPRNFASDLTGRATPFKVISGSGCSPRFRQKCMQIVFWLDITKPLEFVQSVILRIAICSCLSIVLMLAEEQEI
ncbi:hypothetical protein JTE90_017498 [Oedothorax gibbosus]|uniref:Transposase n=1 Tax=Oedothorax gibbosus TaxID=931172 RepID=A0AAV6UC58_9ARAC|nr:hypothetical protein JTE90_017498 [Oedothorax gibbosus]